MAFQWDDSLVPGFEMTDHQLRSIFEQFYKLSEAVQHGKATEIIEELASFLFEYTYMHFPGEENNMVEYNYPRIEHEGAAREVAIVVTGMLLMWITQNITRKHDIEMVAYVKNSIAFKQKYEN